MLYGTKCYAIETQQIHKKSQTKIRTLRVYLGSIYSAETENFLLKVL